MILNLDGDSLTTYLFYMALTFDLDMIFQSYFDNLRAK